MIHLATVFAEQEKFDAQFLVMDAQNLAFADASFDIVIARNVTWTLPDVPRAYREWLRVLKKGGNLINIDGNYGASSMTDTSHLPQHHAHYQLSQETLTECERIQRSLAISSEVRPQWDVQYLLTLCKLIDLLAKGFILKKMNFIIQHLYSCFVLKSKEWK